MESVWKAGIPAAIRESIAWEGGWASRETGGWMGVVGKSRQATGRVRAGRLSGNSAGWAGGADRGESGREDFVHVHAAAFAVEADGSVRDGEDGVVLAETDAFAGDPFGAALADDDIAGDDLLTAEFLDAEAFAAAVTTVLDGTLTFLVSHISEESGGGERACEPGSGRDGFDADAGEGAAVALGAVVTFAALVFEVGDFVCAELIDHGGLDGRSADFGVADAHVAVVSVEENFFEADGAADGGIEFFDVDLIACGNAVLFTAGLDDCESHKPVCGMKMGSRRNDCGAKGNVLHTARRGPQVDFAAWAFFAFSRRLRAGEAWHFRLSEWAEVISAAGSLRVSE